MTGRAEQRVEAEQLADRVRDEMGRLLDAEMSHPFLVRVLSGFTTLAVLRVFGCVCKLRFSDPLLRALVLDPSCPLHTSDGIGEGIGEGTASRTDGRM